MTGRTDIRRLAQFMAALALTVGTPLSAQSPAKSSAQIADLLPAALQSCPGSTVTTDPEVERQSVYVPAADGVKLAVDIFLPKGLAPGTKLPTYYAATRYWRGQKNGPISPRDKKWIARGFAVVNADVRGTGASFGQWYIPYAPQEVQDVGFLANWIATQSWSNGKVVMSGGSYPGTTALMSPAYGQPAIKAIAPVFSDFDAYTDLEWPGGVASEALLSKWGGMVRALDLNQPRPPSLGVRPVDGPDGETQLAAAVEDHKANPWSFEQATYEVTFKDLPLMQYGGMPIDASGVFNVQDAIQRSRVPIFGWGSWLDSGIAQGLVNRFNTWTNPQFTIIGPWTHGARMDVNVFTPNKDVEPSWDAQEKMIYCYLSNYVSTAPHDFGSHTLIYYTMGEDRWKETSVWPIPGTRQERLYLDAGHALSSAAPTSGGHDTYAVDFEAAAGPANRWATQAGGPRIDYGDRAAADRKLLVYTGSPLAQDVELTGQPVITLRVASNQTDGNFFVYVEDVAPSGKVTYVTEGELRALHRNLSNAKSQYQTTYPYRSYSFRDAQLLVPGQTATLTFQLMATSALFRTGHQIRVAIAGADSGTFLRIPAKAQGPVTLTVSRGGSTPSFIDLPIVAARAAPQTSQRPSS